ncbi:MAG: sulfurtransferase complex subunit TusB [Betaproteobacteria bacterium]|jgi:tRNA 2-thiouridine synthesizing protein B|nr:sulfurtransferase complex subunit TusB [Betaproteobacteria bacterium]
MLHIVNKSPYERNTLESCLRLARKGSKVLLIEDAVTAAVRGGDFAAKLGAAMELMEIYALVPDLAARGLKDRVLPGVRLVDYGGFVDLAAENKPVQSWL